MPGFRKRGRPRNTLPSVDYGTPELIMKRLHNVTAEAIDLCLERGLITPEQHWCGIHLRWLHTLRYGAPGVRAIDPTHLGGKELLRDDAQWRQEREDEFQMAMDTLAQLPIKHATEQLLALCVFNQRPALLTFHSIIQQGRYSLRNLKEGEREIEHLAQSLEALTVLWGRVSKPFPNKKLAN